MLRLSAVLAREIMLRSQGASSLKGAGDYSQVTKISEANASPFPQAVAESMGLGAFFDRFPYYALPEALQGKDVLDFGCGYGGKAVDYHLKYGARRVSGVEPHKHVVEKCQQYANFRGASVVEFKVCTEIEIPYPDETFDIALSHDVLEHVKDPRVSVAEIRRVLRPGGLSFNAFPLYFGAESHHLDYISKVPCLHWVFSATTLVTAVNSILKDHPHIMALQPYPSLAFDGSGRVLPGLNGLSGRHLESLFRDFEVLHLYRHEVPLWPFGRISKAVCRSNLPMIVRDAATGAVSCVLRKPTLVSGL
jgi:SAM-dependent methyltransferase